MRLPITALLTGLLFCSQVGFATSVTIKNLTRSNLDYQTFTSSPDTITISVVNATIAPFTQGSYTISTAPGSVCKAGTVQVTYTDVNIYESCVLTTDLVCDHNNELMITEAYSQCGPSLTTHMSVDHDGYGANFTVRKQVH